MRGAIQRAASYPPPLHIDTPLNSTRAVCLINTAYPHSPLSRFVVPNEVDQLTTANAKMLVRTQIDASLFVHATHDSPIVDQGALVRLQPEGAKPIFLMHFINLASNRRNSFRDDQAAKHTLDFYRRMQQQIDAQRRESAPIDKDDADGDGTHAATGAVWHSTLSPPCSPPPLLRRSRSPTPVRQHDSATV